MKLVNGINLHLETINFSIHKIFMLHKTIMLKTE